MENSVLIAIRNVYIWAYDMSPPCASGYINIHEHTWAALCRIVLSSRSTLNIDTGHLQVRVFTVKQDRSHGVLITIWNIYCTFEPATVYSKADIGNWLRVLRKKILIQNVKETEKESFLLVTDCFCSADGMWHRSPDRLLCEHWATLPGNFRKNSRAVHRTESPPQDDQHPPTAPF